MQENQFLLFLNHLRLPYSIPKSFALLLNIHVARHTFAVWALNSGVDIHKISTMMAHSSVITTEKVYAKFLPKNLEKEVQDKLNFNLLYE